MNHIKKYMSAFYTAFLDMVCIDAFYEAKLATMLPSVCWPLVQHLSSSTLNCLYPTEPD